MQKRMLRLITVMLLLMACNKDSHNAENNITGTWKLTDSYYSIGGPGEWHAADSNNPTLITFGADGSFHASANSFTDIDRYEINNDSTIITFFRTATQDSFAHGYEIVDAVLSLRPPCIEGCEYRYVRVGDE